MDNFEKVGYSCLGLIAVLYLGAMVAGVFAAGMWGILGLIVLVGMGALVIKVLKERFNNPEDDHYSRNVDK